MTEFLDLILWLLGLGTQPTEPEPTPGIAPVIIHDG